MRQSKNDYLTSYFAASPASDEGDWYEMEDREDLCVFHETIEKERHLHVRKSFVRLPCPCQPEIEVYEGCVRVIHRRLQ